ncbi:N-formylglutamate amidohydrolase [Tropicibacter oceani]|uniref:N-formylglutamate amidohydrolase n=1 Tax=Tropicibacter oceani TaxID=3058420 RepID=A0ABY8QL93_9RHOB|nr:N-formylglutamate amidohydrolase [Tropicibacter oceani]WGW04728.1 N-formylglutamate amidohydrolase [Tropicibacter oceani]
MDALDWPAVAVFGDNGDGAVVLVCEHASAFIPPALDGLGIGDSARLSHVAWDIGALDMARRLCARMRAPLVAGQVSRLVYDCNRPLEAPDCIPAKSEVHDVPGNRGLSDAARRARFDHIHTPFHDTVAQVLDRQIARVDGPVTLITLHSFTPVYFGQRRDLELGFLFHSRGDVAEAAVQIETRKGVMKAAVNAPYSATDGVTYSLQKHGDARGLPSVMVEVRNDLIDTEAKAQAVADHLADTLTQAIAAATQGASA